VAVFSGLKQTHRKSDLHFLVINQVQLGFVASHKLLINMNGFLEVAYVSEASGVYHIQEAVSGVEHHNKARYFCEIVPLQI